MENSKTSLLKLLVALNAKVYISICNLCLYTKLTQHLPLNKLYPLLVSNIWWEIISIDFIVKLPKSTSFDIIMIVINSMSKKTHFISTYTTVTTESTVRLFFWKLYVLPTYVILDRKLQFITYFTKKLYHMLEIKIASSITWYS